MVASFGIGNTVQANAASTVLDVFTIEKKCLGFTISLAVGVILGGVKRIGFIASRLVPFVITYVILCLFVILKNIDSIHGIFKLIFADAFNLTSGSGLGCGSQSNGLRQRYIFK